MAPALSDEQRRKIAALEAARKDGLWWAAALTRDHDPMGDNPDVDRALDLLADKLEREAMRDTPLTNDYTLIKVPKRHARRAELAVVLAELAEACEPVVVVETFATHAWWFEPCPTTRPYLMSRSGVYVEVGDKWVLEAPGLYREFRQQDLGSMPTDPLGAARLALAHGRGKG